MKRKDMLKQAQELQSKMAKAQEELANETVEGTAGGGGVTVTVTGQQEVKSIKISPEVVDPGDVEMLEDMIMAAVNDAMGKAKELMEKRLGRLASGFNIPGL